jgi:nucleolar GTP-binding protein
MAFLEIKPIESGERYLDTAIKRAKSKSAQLKVRGTKLDKIKTLEMMKIAVVRDRLVSRLDEILKTFPRAEDLSLFYRKLVEYTIGKGKFKKALGKVRWSRDKINDIFRHYNSKLKKVKDLKDINKIKRVFYGRISSLIKNHDYKFLEEARRTLQSFPTIKKRYKQVAIAGFPNVGKSTLLAKLTGSKPEIAAYPFTTKGIMIGYIDHVQLLDTPGTLNRFNKMNPIEQRAYLAMKTVAEEIIYIFDLTEPYPLKEQIRLYERVKGLGKPVVIYLSKTDISDKAKIDEFKKRYDVITDINELKKKIIQLL